MAIVYIPDTYVGHVIVRQLPLSFFSKVQVEVSFGRELK